jgi:hypothetical protein
MLRLPGGWYSGRRHPRRCGEMSETKASLSPARPPGTVGSGGRSHTSAAPGIGAIPLPFPRPADPNDGSAPRPAPHRQNYVDGYVFAQRLSGEAEQPPDACGRQSRTPHAPLDSHLCWRCARSSFFGELAQGYRWENASPRIPPRNRAKGNEVAAIPTNLPQEQNRFVGRERELGELRQLLGATRALTLCGTGGIGKTRLALQILAAVADEFPDGVWFVELGDLQQPDLVVSRVAAAVGVGEEPGRPLLETLADALRPPPAAPGARQLRASDRRLRTGRPAPAGQLAGAAADGHQP